MVVIIITPFAERDPYAAADVASFNTSKEAISFGLISLIFPIKIIPSTTINGSLDPDIEFCPRTCIEGCPPAEFVAPISNPETLPFSDSKAFVLEDNAIGEFSNLKEETEPVNSFFVVVPYPITTNSSNASASSFNAMDKVF